MKKISLLIICLFLTRLTFAQSVNYQTLNGKKITCVVENKTTGGTEIAVDGNKALANTTATGSGPSKTEKLTWEIVLESNATESLSGSKKLKRINFILDRPFGILKYDSENSFESTEGSERLVKKFTDQLGVVSAQKLVVKDKAYEKATGPVNKTDLLWNNNLPIYDANLYWNGLILIIPTSIRLEKGATWNSSLILPDRTVENSFTITQTDGKIIVVDIKSKETRKAAEKNLNAEGAPAGMSLGLTIKEKTFDGTLNVDGKTGLIVDGKIQIVTTSNLSLNGEPSERKSYSITSISNEQKK